MDARAKTTVFSSDWVVRMAGMVGMGGLLASLDSFVTAKLSHSAMIGTENGRSAPDQASRGVEG